MLRPRGERSQIFPVTKSPDPWTWRTSPAKYPAASVSNGNDLGCFYADFLQADFLRKAYPDVDITAALLASETTTDADLLSERRTFDPLFGNTLEVLYRELGPRRCFTCLAFPMGDSGRQLSPCPSSNPCRWNLTSGTDISAFSYSKKDKLPVFRPTSEPLCEFPTPILQLDSLKSSTHPNISGMAHIPQRFRLWSLKLSQDPC